MAKKLNYASLFTLRKDGRYMASYTNASGRHFLYDRDPEQLHARLTEVRNKKPAPVTFKDVAEKWEREHFPRISRGTASNYKVPLKTLTDEFGSLPVSDITAADVNLVIMREKSQGFSYKHAATLKSVLKQVLDLAVVDGHIRYNPALSVTMPRGMPRKKVEAPSDDVIKTVVSNLDRPFGDFVAMLLYTGMRTEEAAALTWGDIGKEYISVHAAVDLHGTPILKETKTAAGRREIPIIEKHRRFLTKPSGAKAEDYIFNDGGQLLTRGKITARWERWCRDSGLAEKREYKCQRKGKKEPRTEYDWKPVIMPHQLRHHYATILYEQKVDLLTAKDVMGHSDIYTTQKIYTSLRQKHKAEELQKINDAF